MFDEMQNIQVVIFAISSLSFLIATYRKIILGSAFVFYIRSAINQFYKEALVMRGKAT